VFGVVPHGRTGSTDFALTLVVVIILVLLGDFANASCAVGVVFAGLAAAAGEFLLELFEFAEQLGLQVRVLLKVDQRG